MAHAVRSGELPAPVAAPDFSPPPPLMSDCSLDDAVASAADGDPGY